VIGYDPVPCNASPIVAQAQGFFRDEGLDARLVERHPGLIDLSTGIIDVVSDGLSWFQAPPFLPTGLSLGDTVATAVLHRGCFSLVVTPDSTVRTLADLRGTTVAGNKYFFGEQLAYAGLDPAVDVMWQPPPPTAKVLDLLESGSVAAVQVQDG
jgi:ABC-type nitrate/sulfonate/bicarbonate transport system substrate-binding protein